MNLLALHSENRVDEEGFLKNPEDWNEDVAAELAVEVGIESLIDEHWKVIHFMRNDFKENGKVPTIRRMKKAGNIPIKDLYKLFPDGPAKKAAKVSGLSKPQGCV